MAKKLPQVKFIGEQPQNNIAKAKIPASLIGTKVSLPHRHLKAIDVNIEVEVEKGYKLCYSLIASLVEKGMVCPSAPGNIKSGKVSVTVINCGREIVDIRDGDDIVNVWIEQDMDFDWISEQT